MFEDEKPQIAIKSQIDEPAEREEITEIPPVPLNQLVQQGGAVTRYDGGSVEVYSLDDVLPESVLPSYVVNSSVVAEQPPAPIVESAPLPIPEQSSQDVVTVSSGNSNVKTRFFFDHGSSKLDQKSLQLVAAIKNQFQQNPDVLVSIDGHASVRGEVNDPVERQVRNLKMSAKRALAVADALIRSGVPASSVRIVGYGEAKPAPAIEGLNKEEASRRVEIIPFKKN